MELCLIFMSFQLIHYLGDKLRVPAAATIFKLLSLTLLDFLFRRLRALCVFSSVGVCFSVFFFLFFVFYCFRNCIFFFFLSLSFSRGKVITLAQSGEFRR